MTPADIERAVTALRRAFPHVADEGVERFRRELAPLPVWRWATATSWRLDRGSVALALCEARFDRWSWGTYAAPGYDHASTLDDAMRAAERALGLPECEVVP